MTLITVLVVVGLIVVQYLLAWFTYEWLVTSYELGKRKESYPPIDIKYRPSVDEKYGFWVVWMVLPVVGIIGIIGVWIGIYHYKEGKNSKFTNPMKWLVKEMLSPKDNV